MSPPINWQSYSFTFPPIGYVIYVKISNQDHDQVIFQPLSIFFKHADLHILPEIIAELTREVHHGNPTLEVTPSPLLLKLRYYQVFNLTKSMWRSRSIKYAGADRLCEFYRLIKRYPLYRVLVLPTFHDQDSEQLEVAMPILANTKISELKKMMPYFNYPVDQTAQQAALYEPLSTHEYDPVKKRLLNTKPENLLSN